MGVHFTVKMCVEWQSNYLFFFLHIDLYAFGSVCASLVFHFMYQFIRVFVNLRAWIFLFPIATNANVLVLTKWVECLWLIEIQLYIALINKSFSQKKRVAVIPYDGQTKGGVIDTPKNSLYTLYKYTFLSKYKKCGVHNNFYGV